MGEIAGWQAGGGLGASWRQSDDLLFCAETSNQAQCSLVWVGVVHLQGREWDERKAWFSKNSNYYTMTKLERMKGN